MARLKPGLEVGAYSDVLAVNLVHAEEILQTFNINLSGTVTECEALQASNLQVSETSSHGFIFSFTPAVTYTGEEEWYSSENFFLWDNMEKVCEAKNLTISYSEMEVQFDHDFSYTVGNLLVGIKQVETGTYNDCSWVGDYSNYNASLACFKEAAENYYYYELLNFLPKVTSTILSKEPNMPSVSAPWAGTTHGAIKHLSAIGRVPSLSPCLNHATHPPTCKRATSLQRTSPSLGKAPTTPRSDTGKPKSCRKTSIGERIRLMYWFRTAGPLSVNRINRTTILNLTHMNTWGVADTVFGLNQILIISVPLHTTNTLSLQSLLRQQK